MQLTCKKSFKLDGLFCKYNQNNLCCQKFKHIYKASPQENAAKHKWEVYQPQTVNVECYFSW